VTKKTKDEGAPPPPATGTRLAAAYLLQPLHMKTTTFDGTISPGLPGQEGVELYDEGRFLQVRRGNVVRNIPWTHVRHWTPMGAE
jgi:hypothetical protein